MASHVKVVTKSAIKRDWLDIEPKVYAALAGGSAVAAVLLILHLLKVPVDPAVEAFLPELAGVAAAYVKASVHKGDLAERVQKDGVADAALLAQGVALALPQAAPVIAEVEQVIETLHPQNPGLAGPIAVSTASTPAASAAVAE